MEFYWVVKFWLKETFLFNRIIHKKFYTLFKMEKKYIAKANDDNITKRLVTETVKDMVANLHPDLRIITGENEEIYCHVTLRFIIFHLVVDEKKDNDQSSIPIH